MLFMAAYEDASRNILTKLVNIKRGQIIASNRWLRDRWQYIGDKGDIRTPSPATIQNFLKMLENDGMIECATKELPNRITLITILNYDKYQAIPGFQSAHHNNTESNTNDKTNDKTNDNEINKYNKLNNITTTSLNAREKNLEYLSQYFDTANSATLEQTLMSLRRDNSAITMQDFKNIAWEVVSEWMQNKEPPAQTYTDFAKRLINTIRIINRNNKRNAIFEQQHPTTKTKAERDAEFAAFIAEKLSRNGTTKQIPDWG